MIKVRKSSFLFSFLLLIPLSSAFAQINGGQLTYEYIGSSVNPHRYKVELYLWAPANLPIDSLKEIAIISACDSSVSLHTLNFIPPFTGGITYIPPPAPYEPCADSAYYDPLLIMHYAATINLNSSCNEWYFNFQDCCRNTDLLNVQSGSDSLFWLQAYLNNSLGLGSSPVFVNSPLYHYCTFPAHPVRFNIATYDRDNDSVHSEIIQPLGKEGTPLAFTPPFSIQQPFPSISPPVKDSSKQFISFIPNTTGRYFLYWQQNEYRYNNAIGQYVKTAMVMRANSLYFAPLCDSSRVHWKVKFYRDKNTSINCTDSILKVDCSTRFQFESLDPYGGEFVIANKRGDTIQIDSAYTIDGTDILLKIPNIPARQDSFHLYVKEGPDGNTLINTCGFELLEDTLNIEVLCQASVIENFTRSIIIHPNPVENFIQIKTELPIAEWCIYNSSGQQLKCSSFFREQQIDCSFLPPGFYFIKCYLRNQQSIISSFIMQ